MDLGRSWHRLGASLHLYARDLNLRHHLLLTQATDEVSLAGSLDLVPEKKKKSFIFALGRHFTHCDSLELFGAHFQPSFNN